MWPPLRSLRTAVQIRLATRVDRRLEARAPPEWRARPRYRGAASSRSERSNLAVASITRVTRTPAQPMRWAPPGPSGGHARNGPTGFRHAAVGNAPFAPQLTPPVDSADPGHSCPSSSIRSDPRHHLRQPHRRLADVRVLERGRASRTTGTWSISGSRAVGGAALVMTEATAVTPRAGSVRRTSASGATRTSSRWRGSSASSTRRAASPACSWRTPDARRARGGRGRAGRRGRAERRLDAVVAPSAMPFADGYPMPQALTADGIRDVVAAFAAAARRALRRPASASSRSTPRTAT